jgi:hypothetical protein
MSISGHSNAFNSDINRTHISYDRVHGVDDVGIVVLDQPEVVTVQVEGCETKITSA